MALWSKSKAHEKSGSAPTETAQRQPFQPAAAQKMSPAEVQARAGASRRSLLAFGQIVSLLMRTQQFSGLPLAAVEALVVPAVLTRQYLVGEVQSTVNGIVAPVAAVLWASVSEDVDLRLSENLDKPFQLAPNEWKSGTLPWLILAAGDETMVNALLKQLQEKILGGKDLKMLVKRQDGKGVVGHFRPGANQPGAAVS
jgi:hemolysin-activating ACP:hemolysin acyltransferase